MSKDRVKTLQFPKFLLPSVFSTKPSAGLSPTDHRPQNTKTEKYLDGHVSYLRCAGCASHLCWTSQIISKGFTGRHGRAYLVSAEPVATAVSVSASSSPTASLPNTILQRPVPRQLVTGAHTVSDVSCTFCDSVLGWKYVAAEEESQRYKVGKFILETKKIAASSCWESPPVWIGLCKPITHMKSSLAQQIQSLTARMKMSVRICLPESGALDLLHVEETVRSNVVLRCGESHKLQVILGRDLVE